MSALRLEPAETPPAAPPGAADAAATEEYAFPAAVGQQKFWLLDQIHPGDPAYNLTIRFRVTGPLRTDVAQQAVDEIVRRHEALRTRFVRDGETLLQVVAPPSPVPLPVDDVERDPDPAQAADRAMAAEARRGFNLETGPVFRARLVRRGADEHMLLITIHQIVSDGWSTGIVLREFAALYEAYDAGRPSPLPEPTLQFADFVLWQSEWLQTPAAAAQLAFWQDHLKGVQPVRIPYDESAASSGSAKGSIESILLPRALTDRLTAAGHQHGATLFMSCLSGLSLLLHSRTGQTDLTVSTPTVGRSKTELEPVVGRFANTVVFRTDLSGDPTFVELLDLSRRTVTDVMANQDIPFTQVLESLPTQGQKDRHALFQMHFIFQKAFLTPATAGPIAITPVRSLSPGAMHELNFFMVERDEGWRASCEYNTARYTPETVRGLLDELQRILEAVAADPSRRVSSFRPADTDPPRPAPYPQPVYQNGRSHARVATPPVSEPATPPVNRLEAYLPTPAVATDPGDARVAPRDEYEVRLAEIWRELLRVDRLCVTANFFDLGGYSLLGARLLVRVQQAFGSRLPPTAVYDSPTVERMAELLRGGPLTPRATTGPSPGTGPAEVAPPGRPVPCFFRQPDRPLYGVYHPAAGPVRREGVVLCAPPGHEYMSSHWCFRLLAAELARAGFPVLRYDPSGVGDSGGEFEQARAAEWIGDVGAAARELADRAGVSDVSLVGLRLGAALAYQATAETRVKHLVLWDPVVNGRQYLAGLRRLHARECPGGRGDPAVEELLGYFYPGPLVEELEQFDLTAGRPAAERVSVLLSQGTDAARLLAHLDGERLRPAVRVAREPGPWEAPVDYTRPVLLHDGRRQVVELLSGGA
ncbi:condensation domain-containing protein [Urbifossiella limnaea]|uniref:Chondramide synthase cmdD n=1 Tax=Urbifossiella limnaea TaxID=2528023 RepID=A0A517Y362_9BACT|nr:condensation domain-containing protein [Urbifossiella limnaea]QDU24171.1 Chondramide synthase cmdD [Urbifossiella limnaea]